MDELSKKRICTHMNDDHMLSLYAMAINYCYQSSSHNVTSTSEIKNVKMIDISLEDYTLSFVYCNGDLCRMERITIPFSKSMSSPSDARIWMKNEHNRVFTPLWCYMYNDPIVWIILIMCTSLAIAIMIDLKPTDDDIFWNYMPMELSMNFKTNLIIAIKGSLIFAIVAHSVEAMYISYLSQRDAKISFRATMWWFVMICLTGYPLTNKYFQLMGGKQDDKKKF